MSIGIIIIVSIKAKNTLNGVPDISNHTYTYTIQKIEYHSIANNCFVNRMFRKQDESDLSSDDLPLSYLQENSPWSRINEKFRCVILDFKLPTVISFLESLLT